MDLNELNMDVDISVSGPDDYADNTVPPLPQGTYAFRLVDWDFEPSKQQGKPPAILVKQAEVAEGPFEGRKVSYQRIYATPFDRTDPSTGTTKKVSQLADFIRSVDSSFDTSNMTIHDVRDFLNKTKEERAIFKAKVDWEGFDSDYYSTKAQEQGIAKGDYKSAAAKELRKASTLRGKQFSDGKPFATNPVSGNKVEAKVKLSNFYPSK